MVGETRRRPPSHQPQQSDPLPPTPSAGAGGRGRFPPARRRGTPTLPSIRCPGEPPNSPRVTVPQRLTAFQVSIARDLEPVHFIPSDTMRDPVSSQYSSFLFWRMPIPELDLSELEGLGLSDTPTYKIKDSSVGKMIGQATGAEQEKNPEGDTLLEYSTFNFWRAPIASIHSFELDLL
ncbi:protein AF1q isoform X2 [Marmota flaviventris]|uniref:protein AF1q isoform X2 n=1 Tax=Marmota flaviventris TaxID=93162 RepID=UPI000FFF6A96|nr:protein AF1q isoform X2 [Marmota flaviventris]